MRKKAQVINLKTSDVTQDKKKRIPLNSGRQIIVDSDEREERIQIVEPKGEVVMSIRITDGGPVVTVHGAHLELKSTETITLDAKKVKIRAQEEASVESKGSLEIASANTMDIQSNDEIRIDGKMIHLN
jgi:phage gp45-like